ncbi:MAG: polysaccharide deacetylase family protein [Oligoflexia bacterium]|nr:polysaccharide deacetylase family protein [Oligoflexia bacterium]
MIKNSARIPIKSNSEIVSRLLLSWIANLLPDNFIYYFFKFIKRFTNTALRKKTNPICTWDFSFNSQKMTLSNSSTLKTGTFSISHDVDYASCYRYTKKLVALDRRYGINSSYFLLTNGSYTLDKQTVFYILDGGNEVALHGKNHNIALGHKSEKYISTFLDTSRKLLETIAGPVLGFRAPALSVSPLLLNILEKHRFSYDSSLCNSKHYSSFTPFYRPYIISNKLDEKNGAAGLIEIPLTIQDSMILNDLGLKNNDIAKIFDHLIKLAKDYYLNLVINFHPSIVEKNIDVYEKIILQLKTSSLPNLKIEDLIHHTSDDFQSCCD